MARYVTTIDSPRSREELFAYLADFSNAAEWDPGVAAAERLGGEGQVALGDEFRVMVRAVRGETPLIYRVTAIERPSSVTFRAESGLLVSLDTITFDRRGGGTRVRYDADLRLKGPLGLADPLLRVVFSRIGDRAREGLCRALDGTVTDS
jgi:carbon monoxide dehydrogenase subunit G